MIYKMATIEEIIAMIVNKLFREEEKKKIWDLHELLQSHGN
jgi:hypothetical protein